MVAAGVIDQEGEPIPDALIRAGTYGSGGRTSDDAESVMVPLVEWT
jgi:hypothetical protein